jgi:hypothetical protein
LKRRILNEEWISIISKMKNLFPSKLRTSFKASAGKGESIVALYSSKIHLI